MNSTKSGAGGSKTGTFVIIGLIAIIVILGYFLFAKGDQAEPTSSEDAMVEDSSEATDTETVTVAGDEEDADGGDKEDASENDGESADESGELVDESRNYTYILPEDWEHTNRAQEAIQALGEGQVISFGIVEDPIEENIVYFAASAPAEEGDGRFIGIYKYNTDNYEWERLYRNTFDEGDLRYLGDEVVPAFRVLGVDNGKLIILAQAMDDSPGPCTEPLLLGTHDKSRGAVRNLLAMDLEEPYSGFEEFTPPEEISLSVASTQSGCLDAMNR